MKTHEIVYDTKADQKTKYQLSLTHSIHNISNSLKENDVSDTRSTAKKITVFLVDDNLIYLKALQHSISAKLKSIQIKTFLTGEECLEQLKLQPQIVILDYYLNSESKNALDGLSILKKIKKRYPKTKVIMLSAQNDLDVAVKCADNGSFDYIIKNEAAFGKINNELIGLVEEIEINNDGLKPYEIIGILIIIILVLSLILK